MNAQCDVNIENVHIKSFIRDLIYVAVLYIYDTLYAILNNSENATLECFIFCKKALDEKHLQKLNNVFKTSSKRFVEAPLS